MADGTPKSLSPKHLLVSHGLRPRKRFGQNFLVDPRFARRVAEALPPDALVVEIGAGTGTLTEALAARARMTIAVELDRDLVGLLRERFAATTNLSIVEGDALVADLRAPLSAETPPRAICGNLPYYITTPLIERVVSLADTWETAVLMVQREYARRLAASAGTPEYSSLTVFVGYHCTVEKLFDVGAAGFYPAPNVASSVVRLTPRANRARGVTDETLLLRTVRAAFAQRRKTLVNCLLAASAGPATREIFERALRHAGLEPGVRGERLNLDDFQRLANALSEVGVNLSRDSTATATM